MTSLPGSPLAAASCWRRRWRSRALGLICDAPGEWGQGR